MTPVVPLDQLILGESLAMRSLRELIVKLAPTRLPVLIEGPTGSGKELVARALHALSGRAGRWVPVNAAAVTDTLFEAEMFGYVKGAFSGAVRERTGFLAEANGGTLFLDEIASLPLTAQPKLLRALETGDFRPVGAPVDRSSAFRLVAAANDDLAALSRRGDFRPDLLHRLAAVRILVPPLDERPEDIPLLAAHFAQEVQHSAGPVTISPGALRVLQERSWPGSVRELRYAIHSAAALAPSAHLDRSAFGEMATLDGTVERPTGGPPRVFAAERRHLVAVLERHAWHVTQAAAALGIHRVTLSRRLRRLGIQRPPGAHASPDDARACVSIPRDHWADTEGERSAM